MQEFRARPPPLTRDADGVIGVTATRVQLEIIVEAFDSGATPEEIVQRYPSVDLPGVYAVISYVLDNRRAVDKYVSERLRSAAALRAEIETKLPPDGIRARLLARRSQATPGSSGSSSEGS
jgi:uncharacterized protein (DUF433 family)